MTQPTVDKARARLAFYIGYGTDEHDALFESYLDVYRAAVLRKAADEAERENADCPPLTTNPCQPCAIRTAVATKLRRMAEEARS